MNPAEPREVDIPGAFFQSQAPLDIKGSEFGHLPQHWYAHVMHAIEVVAYRHPDLHVIIEAGSIYERLARNLHLVPESRDAMIARLSEDRLAAGTVVS